MNNLFYTGIGSRETPPDILAKMTEISKFLASKGFILRSGGADGADAAFEAGADKKQIFLPWKGFNKNKSYFYTPTQECFDLAEKIHPAWDKCSLGAKKLHARNTQQVLGEKLNEPSLFIVCWTPKGEASGGTATAIRLAEQNHIPVFNLGKDGDLEKLREMIRGICSQDTNS